MEPIVDLASLTTIAGATAAVTIIVQFVKILAPDTWGTRAWRSLAAILGVVVLVGATVLSEGVTAPGLILAVLNGMIVGAGASALYDGTRSAAAALTTKD